MKDERPNGKPQFDARFLNTPAGRARAGRSIVWDPRGTMNSGGAQRLENIDITQAMAKKYAAMTNKAAESAFFAEYYDGVNTMGDDGQNAQQDLMLAQMSKLQKKQMDKVCSLYYEAANYFETKSDIEAACFFYTQALVMALEENHDLKEKIIHKLEKYGRNQDTTLN